MSVEVNYPPMPQENICVCRIQSLNQEFVSCRDKEILFITSWDKGLPTFCLDLQN